MSKKNWFFYDPSEGSTFFDTEQEAASLLLESLDAYKEAAQIDGWDEDTGKLCYGKVTHRAAEVDVVRRQGELDESGEDEAGNYFPSHDDYLCNYAIKKVGVKP